ncbi:MAG: hypothetical protein EBZ77_01175 [Chitinophagia bacterium]|nr:hypothetical protein [Chitinophagia bacterium]
MGHDAEARTRAHIRAAEHYRERNPRKAVAHYKRAMYYSSFGSYVNPFSLRFNGKLDEEKILIEDLVVENIKKYGDYGVCTAEIVGHNGGVTEAGYNEFDQCEKKIHVKIATVVASNSGRPGGACRAIDGTVQNVHNRHKTQEEDVISNWMIAETNAVSYDEKTQNEFMNLLFKPVSDAFGLENPGGTDVRTKQGVDYTRGIAIDTKTRTWRKNLGPRIYADAWCYDGATLCEKQHVGRGLMEYVTENTYQTTLVFCSAPNAHHPKGSGPGSSMRRTYSSKANAEKKYFDAGVAWAVYTALYASAHSGCNTVFLPFVGGGVYAGPHKPDIYEFRDTVNKMLNEGLLPDGTRVPALGRCFRRVAIVMIPRTTRYGVSSNKKDPDNKKNPHVYRGSVQKKQYQNEPKLHKLQRLFDDLPNECSICFYDNADRKVIWNKQRNEFINICSKCELKMKDDDELKMKVDDVAKMIANL